MRYSLRPPAPGKRTLQRRCLQPAAALCMALVVGLPANAQEVPDLTALSIEQLLELKIVGASRYAQSQNEVAAAAVVITRHAIKAFGWRTLDEALGSLPGIHTTDNRQLSSVGARGFGLPGDFNTRLLVMINGTRVNEPIYDSGVAGQAFPLDMDLIERIEFIPGPGGAVYGENAMFGVVNVITRKAADLDGAGVSVAFQDPQAVREGRFSWGRQFDNGTEVLLSASGMKASGEDLAFDFGPAEVSGVAAGMDGEKTRRMHLHVGRGPWFIEHSHGSWLKEDPTGSFYSDPLAPGQHIKSTLAITQLQFEDHLADEHLTFTARLFRKELQFRTQLSYGGSRFASDTQSRLYGGELRLLYTAFDHHKLLVGIEGQESPRAEQVVPVTGDPADDLLISSPGHRIGIYAQDEWQISDRLRATLGVRLDHNDMTGTATSPRTGLIWQATPSTTIKALYGHAHRAPNAYERYYDDGSSLVGNPDLRGERIDTLELVADRRVGSNTSLRLSLYQWEMKRLVTLGLHPDSGIPQYQSGDEITARGAEMTFDRTWGSGVRLRTSLSVQDVAYRGGAALVNSPDVLGRVNLSGLLPWGGIRASYELRHDSKKLTSDGSHVGGYAVSNIVLSRQATGKGLEASLGIFNLFDKHYATPGATSNWQNAFEQDGRSVRFELGYQF